MTTLVSRLRCLFVLLIGLRQDLYDILPVMSKGTSKKVHALHWAGLARVSRSEVQALARLTELLGHVMAWGRWDGLEGMLPSLEFRMGSVRVASPAEATDLLADLATTWRAQDQEGREILLGADLYLGALLAAAAAGKPAPAVVPRRLSQAEALVATAAAASLVHALSGGVLHIVEACKMPDICRTPDAASAIFAFGVGLAGGWGSGIAVMDLNRSWESTPMGLRPLARPALHRLSGMEADAAITSRSFALSSEDLPALVPGALVCFGGGWKNGDVVMKVGDLAWSLVPEKKTGLGVQAFSVQAVESRSALRGVMMDEEFGQTGYEGESRETGVDEMEASSAVGTSRAESLQDSDGGVGLDPSMVSGVTLEASVELGRIRVAVTEVLGLAPGALLELDRPIDDRADLRVGGKVVARGRLVDVEGKLGLQITELVG